MEPSSLRMRSAGAGQRRGLGTIAVAPLLQMLMADLTAAAAQKNQDKRCFFPPRKSPEGV